MIYSIMMMAVHTQELSLKTGSKRQQPSELERNDRCLVSAMVLLNFFGMEILYYYHH